jgi:hypothetical protein
MVFSGEKAMRFLMMFLAGFLLLLAAGPVLAQGARDRDYYYRYGPGNYSQYRMYPERRHYPRRLGYPPRLRPVPAPAAKMRDPRSSKAPQYGPPPNAIHNIPRVTGPERQTR